MKLIIDIPEENYKEMCEYGNKRVDFDLKRMIQNGKPIPDNATPCDFCRYNPPSSTDGKPCCMCPATGRSK